MRKSASFFTLLRASLVVTAAGVLLAATVWYLFRRWKP
jgi:hypothetical protein